MMTDRVGEQLGNYRLLRLLGQGGFADVYLGEHLHLGTQAAIKVLHTRLAPDDLEGFRNEARTIARLEHPNIVRVLEFGIEGGIPFLVMSYAPNGSLRERHPKGVPLPLPTTVSYVRQVADALQYAHDEKVIHRDVKPENMLVGRRHEVLLSDFGIALIAQSTSSQSKQDVTGTIHYMAPEQIRGKPRPASDQYALGVVVYEWLTGDRPFHGSFTEIATQHMFQPPPPLREKNPTIAPALEHIVMTALAKEPQQRWASVQAFATALEQVGLPAQHSPIPIASPNQPLAPTVAALPPTQHPWPTIATPPSIGPVQANVMTPQPALSESPQRQITRRAIVGGVAGLGVAALAGGGLVWVLSHAASGSPAVPASTTTPGGTATATPTPPPQGSIFYTYHGLTFNIRVLAWSPNGKRIAGGSDDRTAQVWDAATGNNPLIYRGHSSYVEGVAWSPDSHRIASGSADATVQIWEPATGKLIYTYRGHSLWVNRVSWSPDGKYIASGEQSSIGGHGVQVRVWEAATGNTLVIYRGHTNGVFAVAWSPDGTRVAS
ncbi:MAG TPA: protein kinase, partial [Ktedonobacteraceae bacterium]|nr:protein kinase [Ktedonobacteraceae bacterium]